MHFLYAQILEYHVVPNQVLHAADFTQGQVLNTVLNQTLTVCTPLGAIPPAVHLAAPARCHV